MSSARKLSLANKLSIIGVIVMIITLIATAFPFGENEGKGNVDQKTAGNYSPAINTTRDVNIKY